MLSHLGGDGSGHFPRQARYSAGAGGAFTLFDANGDGLPDLISMGHDPDGNSSDQDFFISLHLKPTLAFKGTTYAVPGGSTLGASVVAVDPSNLPLDYSHSTSPRHGKLTFQSNGNFTYSPSRGFTGVDTFNVSATDGTSTAKTLAMVKVAAPPAPTMTPFPVSVTIDEGSTSPPISFALTGTNPLMLSATTNNPVLLPVSAITWNPDCPTTHSCSLLLAPEAGKTGYADITLTVTDSYGQSATRKLTVLVQGKSSATGGSGSSGGGASDPLVLLALMALWTLGKTRVNGVCRRA